MRDAFLDLLAGGCCVACRRPGRLVCPWCALDLRVRPRPAAPTPCPPGLLPVRTAGDYDGTLRALILAHKERSAFGLVVPLGRLLADVVGAPQPDGVTLVPVPSHPAVVRARGHDPVLRVVRRAARVLRARGADAQARRLLRVVGRPHDQAGLRADERHANLAGRFRARPVGPFGTTAATTGRALLLVDDVMTSGATLREAQRALEVAGWAPTGAVTIAATRRRESSPHLPVCPPEG